MATEWLSQVEAGSTSSSTYVAPHRVPTGEGEDDLSFAVTGTFTLGSTGWAQTRAMRVAECFSSDWMPASLCFESTGWRPEHLEAIGVHPGANRLSVTSIRASSHAPFDVFMDRLRAAIDAEPIEDGVAHTGEGFVEAFVSTHGVDSLCRHAIELPTESPVLSALLRLLGRVSTPNRDVRRELVARFLRSKNVEVRDAIIQAIELWDDHESLDLLLSHNEPVAWLSQYIQQVADDLRR